MKTIRFEHDLYGLWRAAALPGTTFISSAGNRITVISPGKLNDLEGPDFLNGVLLIDGQLQVGHIEMHISEGDWFAHGHQHDPNYAEVILHVLAELPQGKKRLEIPAISARDLVPIDPESNLPGQEKTPDNPFLLLGEFSWHRFLRRVTETIRREPLLEESTQIEREFQLRLFDCLGYSNNRGPMVRLILRLFEEQEYLAEASFEEFLARLLDLSGIPTDKLEQSGKGIVQEDQLKSLLPVEHDRKIDTEWNFRGRPGNRPERRLWGGGKLLFDLYHHNLLERAFEVLAAREGQSRLRELFLVRFGRLSVIGTSRADEIVLNTLLPVAAAAGILRKESRLITGACLAYRHAPSPGSNRTIRKGEERLTGGEPLKGAFLQQGAIEYVQRVIDPDRRGLSMIAEKRG